MSCRRSAILATKLAHFPTKAAHFPANGDDIRAMCHLAAQRYRFLAQFRELGSRHHVAADGRDVAAHVSDAGAQLDAKIGDVFPQLANPGVVSLNPFFQIRDSLVKVGHRALRSAGAFPRARFYIVVSGASDVHAGFLGKDADR